ncbi:DUF2202 domain-containing protein [Variovorax sp. YR752]|uniref:DUF2202 domain-containing protein n=1 Tax=Variovorax sp. YR752 TaxID=1884383 RepID=UPI003137D83A
MQRKQFLRRLGALAGSAAIGPLIAACGGGDAAGPASSSASASVPAAPTAPAGTQPTSDPLSPDEIAGLRFMREEEKLAHDVYVAMDALWGHRSFANIALSETTHTQAILALITKYAVDDPAAGKPAGVFEDPQLQALYDTMVAAGAASLVEALKVGALIEETDIRDIEVRMAATDAADILQVYDSLLCGSRNHLRAFNSALLGQGVTYVAQVISQQQWDAIAYSAHVSCGS